MRRMLIGIVIVVMVLLASGCPPRQTAQEQPEQRVAGTQEQATTVNVELTANGFRVNPANVPNAENVRVRLTNTANQAKTFVVRNQGRQSRPFTLQPGQAVTMTIEETQDNRYVISPVTGQQQQRR